jgi:uncharacterized damage-inducible protein DinB
MNGVQVLKDSLDASHRWYTGTVAGMQPQVAEYMPPGSAHPIGETMAHVLQSEDYIIAGMLQKKPTVWEREDWQARTGMPNVSRQDAETARSFKGDATALAGYQQAVYAQTDAYLSSISDSDLDRQLDLPQIGKMTVGGVLNFILVGNNFAHTGEIAAVKGLQDQKGYPF